MAPSALSKTTYWQIINLQMSRCGLPKNRHPEGFKRIFALCVDKPFCFWLGTSEPHRAYAEGAGAASGKDPSKVVVPSFLPDNNIVRNDILDYYMEVEHFDNMVARAVESIEKQGLKDNTIIVVTSDSNLCQVLISN